MLCHYDQEKLGDRNRSKSSYLPLTKEIPAKAKGRLGASPENESRIGRRTGI
jgi:hypothetical protein